MGHGGLQLHLASEGDVCRNVETRRDDDGNEYEQIVCKKSKILIIPGDPALEERRRVRQRGRHAIALLTEEVVINSGIET